MTLDRQDHPSEEHLHGAAEGTLPAGERAAVEAHLAACEECRADVARIRSLFTASESLPRSIEPPQDLWPAIQARVAGRDSRVQRPGWMHRVREHGWLAAAAVLLIVLSSAITTLFVRDEVPAPTAVTGAAGATEPSAVLVADPYDWMERDLAARFAEQREKLRPETIEKVERNLRIIDQAIGEIRQAMADDPNNEALQQLLKASYSQKQALLHQVSQS